ncbi:MULTISPECIES: sigma-70 family RNA polymerase sigma factor [Streptomyces]|uniref:Sigma-70 family RNA polymerase sigma factor n=2 Tax=Streptomyces TaxID=1883 RepID=A0ABV9IWU1_9ACTN
MTHDLLTTLRPLLAAEASAEAHAGGCESGDLEQAVWLRLLEHLAAGRPPSDPQGWLRRAVRAEVRRSRRTTRVERPYETDPVDERARDHDPEQTALTAARYRALRAAVHKLPGRCSRLLQALLSPEDLTYREIASELGISQGSLGPERSRCLGCLRRLLAPEVAAREVRG